MRARKKKNTLPRLERCSMYISEKIETKGNKPLHLEIGCGKGMFITSLAENTDGDIFALEKVPDIIVMAVEKAAAKELKNIKFIISDAEALPEICPHGCIDFLYLNFSDPWPKRRDTEKRLTHRAFLEKYKLLLKENGEIIMKTDNEKLFDFSLEEFKTAGFTLFDISRDLYSSNIENQYKTEYETRFTEQGLPIFHLKAKIIAG